VCGEGALPGDLHTQCLQAGLGASAMTGWYWEVVVTVMALLLLQVMNWGLLCPLSLLWQWQHLCTSWLGGLYEPCALQWSAG
jgi:hypothetical protein